MAKRWTALRIGVVAALYAGALSDGGCGCTARSRAADASAVTGLDGSMAAGSGSDWVRDAAGDAVVIAAAGDIACRGWAQGATADLLDGLLQTGRMVAVLPLGDEAYASGLLSEFEAFYRPSWGRPELLAVTHPVAGNHEYVDTLATGYFDFFNGPGQMTGAAGPRGQGYYSFDVGGWHVVALNTSDECRWVSCAAGSPQHQGLVADLAPPPAGSPAAV